ncbi:MAG TPA: GreA/GreB family elongation factor [bacterium]
MREDIKKYIEQKDFEGLENAWMEMAEQNQTLLDDYFAIAERLKKISVTEQAYLLLEILAGQYEAINDLDRALAVYKQMPYYTSNDSKAREKTAHLYRVKYKDCLNIEDYLEVSGFEKGEHFFKSLERLDEFLKYDVGKFFYFEKYGIGEIKDVMPLKKEFIIDFEKHPRHFMKFDIARGLLMPLTSEHFLYQKQKNMPGLKELASTDPIGLAKLILSSFPQPLSVAQLKNHVEGIIDKNEIAHWWDKVRKQLEHDINIRVGGKTQKTYQYVSAGVNKTVEAVNGFEKASPEEKYALAEIMVKKDPAAFEKIMPLLLQVAHDQLQQNPGLALDIVLLLNEISCKISDPLNIEDIYDTLPPAEIVHHLQNFNHQRIVLDHISKTNPETWPTIYRSILFHAGTESRLMAEIEQRLASNPDILKDFYDAVFLVPHNHPEQFQWLMKKVSKAELKNYLVPGLVPRFISSLDHVKGLKSTVMKILALERFDELLNSATPDDAQKIIAAVNNSQSLENFEKRDFLRVLEYHFPQLFKREDLIYSTPAALQNKKSELEKLLTVDIPENKKEIGRAREHGDLSENFEYKAAKERQDQLYQKVRDIEQDLPKVKLIDARTVDTSKVSIGTMVSLKNKRSGQVVTFTILGRWDTDLEHSVISNESPLARAMLGKSCGHSVVIDDFEHEIVMIEKGI